MYRMDLWYSVGYTFTLVLKPIIEKEIIPLSFHVSIRRQLCKTQTIDILLTRGGIYI